MYEKGYSSWYSSLYSKRETSILAKVCKQYTFLAGDVARMLIRGGGGGGGYSYIHVLPDGFLLNLS